MIDDRFEQNRPSNIKRGSLSGLEQDETEAFQKQAINDPLAPQFSEEALALRFSDKHGSDLRYTDAFGCWLGWNGMRWVKDDTLEVVDLARQVTREARGAPSADSGAVSQTPRADRRGALSHDGPNGHVPRIALQ